MSFNDPNGTFELKSRQKNLKAYFCRATLANGADPTIVFGDGFKLARAAEGSYTVTLDESMQAANGVLWWDVKVSGQTDLQYCSATVGDVGDSDDGLTMTISTGTVDASNARTPDDLDAAVLLICIVGFGPGVSSVPASGQQG